MSRSESEVTRSASGSSPPNYPYGLVCGHTLVDVRLGSKLTRTAALEAYAMLLDGKPIKLDRLRVTGPKVANGMGIGDLNNCYVTTDYMVETMGGEQVFGWHFLQTPMRHGTNDFGNIDLHAHVVWKRPEDGALVEVTNVEEMGLDIFGFYPHKRVKYGSQTSIHPVDDFGICKAIIAAFNDEVESMEVRIPARK